LYPNPSDGATQLQLPGISGKSVITLADVTGRILQQQVISGESCTIETTSLSDGMYVITVADLLTRRQTSKRLIVQH